ncbi:MAG: glycosyltransferase family 4 protein [Pseudomonadota bacterium]
MTDTPETADTDSGSKEDRIKVFVHLAHGQDVIAWEKMWSDGCLVGINDKTPYGYHRARNMGCDVDFSLKIKNSPILNMFRLAFRVIFGFDYIHAYNNKKAALKSDVIWTHTESQFLAIALMMALRGKNKPRPKILAQSVWLYDKWATLDPIRKAFYRYLVGYVDILTVHSRLNLEVAKKLFPNKLAELVRYGIPHEGIQEPKMRANDPHRVVCVGNDRHRDWQTAVDAFANQPGFELKIFSTKLNPNFARGATNVEIRGLRTDDELKQEMAAASIMVVPLKPNLHASGATVSQEAIIHGIPLIVSDVGGLDDYYDADAVTFVPAQDPAALRRAAKDLLNDPRTAMERAKRAQIPMQTGELNADRFIEQHVEISRELLGMARTVSTNTT